MDSNLKPLSASFLYIHTGRQLRFLCYQLAGGDLFDRHFETGIIRSADWDKYVPYMWVRAYQTGIAFFAERKRQPGNRYESLLYAFSGRQSLPSMVYLPSSVAGHGDDWWSLPEGGFILTFHRDLSDVTPFVSDPRGDVAVAQLGLVYNAGAIYDGRL